MRVDVYRVRFKPVDPPGTMDYGCEDSGPAEMSILMECTSKKVAEGYVERNFGEVIEVSKNK